MLGTEKMRVEGHSYSVSEGGRGGGIVLALTIATTYERLAIK